MTTPLIDGSTGPPEAAGPAPERSIVCCAVPGAGEGAVARALHAVGAGEARAWFDIDAVARDLAARWQVDQVDEYVAALHRHRTSPDGVFAMILHWHQLRRLHRQVAELTQPTPERLLAVVERIAPEPTFVWVRRAERAAHVAALAASPYGAGAVGTPEHLLDAGEAVWAQWFADAGITPVEVHADIPAEVDALPARLGLPGGTA